MVFWLLYLGSFYGYAQNKAPGIIVDLANGQKIEYRLTDNPKFVYDGQTITLTADGVRVEYMPTELLKVTTGEVQVLTGIRELETQQGNIDVAAGFVRLTGFTNGEAVRIYSVGGSLKATYHTSADGSLVIPISALPSGISIIKTNEQTIKITKR